MATPQALPPGTPATAAGVARVRALESARPDRLFEDPLAQTFADAFPRPPGSPGPAGGSAPSTRLALQIVVRTRFYDEYLVAATEGGCRQVVLVGAGLDTRAFRLAWPAGTVVYELDLPEVIEAKASVLARAGARPQSDRRVVSVDLRQDWGTALVDAGFDGTSPTAWLIEGVLVYLDAAEAEGLLVAVTRLSAPGSRLSCERGTPAGIIAGVAAVAVGGPWERLTALWKGGLPEVASWLDDHGWRVEVHPLAAVAESYGRPISGPTERGFLVAGLPSR